jgi:predicted ATPase
MTELTVSQLGDALQTLLERTYEGIMTRAQMKELAERLAADIVLTQDRNRRARESHIRRRKRELKLQGIDCEKMTSCDVEVAL